MLTLHYRVTGADGAELISTFGHRPATFSVGAGELSPALEERLIGLEEGVRERFELGAGEAFGAHNPALLQRVRRSLLAELGGGTGASYAVGDVVRFPSPGGQAPVAGVVRDVGPDSLLLDFNHPLAGRSVRFEVQVLGVIEGQT